jgi:hypothetical protein
LLDFGAGLLVGLSVIVALFAAMEDSDGNLSHDLLLVALATLAGGFALKLTSMARYRRRTALRMERRRDASSLDAGWIAEGAGQATDVHATDWPHRKHGEPRGDRATAVVAELDVVPRDARGSAADSEPRRL